VRALGQIGGQPAIDALVPLLTAGTLDANVRLEAVTAIGALRAAAASDALMDLASDPWPAMRAQALRALSLADPNAFVFALSGLDPDPHWSVRASVATTLAAIDPAIAVPRLQPMLEDADRRVVPAVLAALAQLKAPGVEGVLRAHLDDPDVAIRLTAARELGELQPADGATVFADAYHRWSADTTYVARAAALGALAKYGTAAVETLKAALGDREWAVRLRALELLEAMDPAADAQAIRPVPGTAAVAYDTPDMLAPKFSPHIYLETRHGLVEIELAVNEAPLTAQTILTLARKGFFTGIPFHRVVPNFVVQGGDPRGDGEGGPGYTIRDEINQVPYLRGTVGMALDWRDTGGSQFFITHSPQPHLDARYTVFGRVVNGMDVVDKLQQWDVIERVKVWDGVNLTGR
jgi:cyclophilin family peptidyl-prolyl cis-trans isomerase